LKPAKLLRLSLLNIQISHILGVFLDKLPPRFDRIAHKSREQPVGLFGIFHFNQQQRSGFGIHGGPPELFRVHLTETFVALYRDAVFAKLGNSPVALLVGENILLFFAFIDPIEGRLSDIDIPLLYQFLHIAEEESQDQGANMRPVDIGVSHDNDFTVPQIGNIEIFSSDTGSESGNHGSDFLVGEDFIQPCLFDIEDLTTEGQDGLEFTVTALFGRTAGRVTLDDVYFA